MHTAMYAMLCICTYAMYLCYASVYAMHAMLCFQLCMYICCMLCIQHIHRYIALIHNTIDNIWNWHYKKNWFGLRRFSPASNWPICETQNQWIRQKNSETPQIGGSSFCSTRAIVRISSPLRFIKEYQSLQRVFKYLNYSHLIFFCIKLRFILFCIKLRSGYVQK
jgi:hypothetical protein